MIRDAKAIVVAAAALLLSAGTWAVDAVQPSPTDLLDMAGFERAGQDALERGPVGQAVVWRDAEAGVTAVITPAKAYRDRSGRWCRPYELELAADNLDARRRQVACRDDTGAWVLPPPVADQVAETE